MDTIDWNLACYANILNILDIIAVLNSNLNIAVCCGWRERVELGFRSSSAERCNVKNLKGKKSTQEVKASIRSLNDIVLTAASAEMRDIKVSSKNEKDLTGRVIVFVFLRMGR